MEMDDAPEIEPNNLRFLRRLVTLLTAVMIVGLLAIFTLIVIQFSRISENQSIDGVTLPEGVAATAYTRGAGWYAIVGSDNNIRIYDLETQELRQEIQVQAGE